MISFKDSFGPAVHKVVSVAFTVLFSAYSLSGGLFKEPPKTPDDFKPVLRFAVCSDVHLGEKSDGDNANKFRNFFKQIYNYSDSQKSYNSLDAVLVCGDFSEQGKEAEYINFSKIVEDNLKDGTELLTCMGNHEFIEERNGNVESAYDFYQKFVNENVDINVVINGYRFIGVSYSDKDENYSRDKIKWLDEQLKAATKENKDMPVFVFQHPHPTLTVYGSVHWGEITIRSVLEKYPQVVNFSGHSHYASTDPRTVWQGSFTAVGTGGITGLYGNINYLDQDASSDPRAGSYLIVEVDKDGNIRMQTFDVMCGESFTECERFFKNPAEKKNRVYNWTNIFSLDTKPSFPEKSEIMIAENEEGETIITFPEASGYHKAESYRITVKSGLKNIYKKTVLSNYIFANATEVTVNLGTLQNGEYLIKIVPTSPYAKTGTPLKAEFTVE